MSSIPTSILVLAVLTSFAIIIILIFVILAKLEKAKKLQIETQNLKNSLDQTNEQAKLIVRTDLELNKIQEELDKKVSGLYTLQSLSREFASSLDEKEIFDKIKHEHIAELGIQRALGYVWQTEKNKFINYLSLGYKQQELDDIKAKIEGASRAYLKLIEQKKTVSSLISNNELLSIDETKQLFGVKAFCISPILPQEGNCGLLFMGTTSEDVPITEGDEELITILANSIGQALENARLFEKTWRAQQELETRVEQRTKELTEAVEELKKVNKRKSDFVSAVSHELRTPLTSIKGYAAILLSKNLGEIPDAVKERLKKVNQHSDELVHMVNDLLDISRLESGRIAMKKEVLELKTIVDTVIDLLLVQIKDKNIELSTDIPDGFSVMVDKSQIERVFINLVGNAIKFTPEKGKISVEAKPADKFIQINITDSGIGIPKSTQEAIFEEFYRVENPINDEVKGTGLGLSLVKHIIEAHQGLIWVESQFGQGAIFSFLLPIAAEIDKTGKTG